VQGWFGVPAADVLGAPFDPVGVVRS
jgi:hypothetical protein